MFEEYLKDAHFFLTKAIDESEIELSQRYYRVSIFCELCAIESYVNYIAQPLELAEVMNTHETAFLLEKKVELIGDKFEIIDKMQFQKLEDKLRFLIIRFDKTFDFEKNPCWPRFMELKRKRDELTHPRHDKDDTSVSSYERISKNGLNAIIEIINRLSTAIFKRGLRKQILDLIF